MIENFWGAFAILVTIIGALLGASWKLFSNIDNHRSKYQENAMGLKAILTTNEVQPALVKFSYELEKFRKKHPGHIEKFFEDQESNREIKIIMQATRKVVKIEDIIEEIHGKCSDCGYDFIGLAVSIGVLTVFFYFEPSEILYYILIAIAVIIFKTAYDFVKYRKGIRLLIMKDKEIRENW